MRVANDSQKVKTRSSVTSSAICDLCQTRDLKPLCQADIAGACTRLYLLMKLLGELTPHQNHLLVGLQSRGLHRHINATLNLEVGNQEGNLSLFDLAVILHLALLKSNVRELVAIARQQLPVHCLQA